MGCFNNKSRVSADVPRPKPVPAAKAKASLLWYVDVCGRKAGEA